MKNAPDFVKNLEIFHFGEKNFHRNDSHGKVVAHCALVKVNFEYSDHWDKDEEISINACNMTTLNKRFRYKITTTEGKGSSSTTEQKKQQEEAAEKQEEDACKLVEEAERLLAEEAQREKLEEERLKKEQEERLQK